MGYDHFALLGLAEDPTDEEFELMTQCLKELRKEHDEPIFGEVHHLSSGGFNEYWWGLFDESIKKLYEKTNIRIIYLYLCEYDGECLTKYEYVKGKKNKEMDITMIISDPDVQYFWDVRRLSVNRGITIYYNKEYYYEYE